MSRTPEHVAPEGSLQGQPAIIVSAGPSLRKNKHLLQGRAGQGRHHRGADDASAAAGDGDRAALRHVARLSRHLHAILREAAAERCETELVAEPKATSAIFDLNPGPLSLLGNDFAEGLLRGDGAEQGAAAQRGDRRAPGVLPRRASRLRSDHLRRPGPGLLRRPVLRAGHQLRRRLAAGAGALLHGRDEAVGADRPRAADPPRESPITQGRPMYTEERLFTYLQQFERDFLAAKSEDHRRHRRRRRQARRRPSCRSRQAMDQYCRTPSAPAWPTIPASTGRPLRPVPPTASPAAAAKPPDRENQLPNPPAAGGNPRPHRTTRAASTA